MANYRQDPEKSKKQRPGELPDNAYERTKVPTTCTFTKTPSYVLVTKTMTKPFGFFFGTSESFAHNSRDEGNTAGTLTSSKYYDTDFGLMTVGTRLDIHPTAWTGSSDDSTSIRFIYRSGLSTGGR